MGAVWNPLQVLARWIDQAAELARDVSMEHWLAPGRLKLPAHGLSASFNCWLSYVRMLSRPMRKSNHSLSTSSAASSCSTFALRSRTRGLACSQIPQPLVSPAVPLTSATRKQPFEAACFLLRHRPARRPGDLSDGFNSSRSTSTMASGSISKTGRRAARVLHDLRARPMAHRCAWHITRQLGTAKYNSRIVRCLTTGK